jgi:hypothetical protein
MGAASGAGLDASGAASTLGASGIEAWGAEFETVAVVRMRCEPSGPTQEVVTMSQARVGWADWGVWVSGLGAKALRRVSCGGFGVGS